MDETLQSDDIEIVDLGDAKELTMGKLQANVAEDNPVLPRRDIL